MLLTLSLLRICLQMELVQKMTNMHYFFHLPTKKINKNILKILSTLPLLNFLSRGSNFINAYL